jgi:hypothetical protein
MYQNNNHPPHATSEGSTPGENALNPEKSTEPDQPAQMPQNLPPDPAVTEQRTDSFGAKCVNSTAPHQNIVLLPSWYDGFEETAKEIFVAFAKLNSMFLQGRNIVEIASDSQGGCSLVPLTPSALRSRLEKLGHPHARRAGDKGKVSLRPAQCSDDQAKALLATQAAQRHLPRISAVVSCPVPVEGADGKLKILTKGYHAEMGGIFITRGAQIPNVPLEEAKCRLHGLVDEFHFRLAPDYSRMLASMISPALALGGLLNGARVPMTLTVAECSQSGKTYSQRVSAAIYGEAPYVIAQRKKGVGGLEESFSHALLTGKPFIQIDNLRGAIDSEYIESFMTAETFAARIPHRQEAVINTSRFNVMVTSNDMRPTRDFLNRCSLIRLLQRPKDEPFKVFPEGDLLAQVKANQPYYLGCIYSIIRAWMDAGRPRTQENRHHFRAWAQSLDWIVQNICNSEPLLENYDRTIGNFERGYMDDEFYPDTSNFL